jgi:hypothetical protein
MHLSSGAHEYPGRCCIREGGIAFLDAPNGRRNLLEQLHPLAVHRNVECGEPGNVAVSLLQAGDETLANRGGYLDEYTWYHAGCFRNARFERRRQRRDDGNL